MSDCCILARFPKKYLHYVKRADGTLAYIMLSETEHNKLKELTKNHPEARLTIKETINE